MFPIATYPLSLAGGVTRIPVRIGGLLLHCTSATWPFLVSIDGSPNFPFFAGSLIAPRNPDGTPYKFTEIEVIQDPAHPGDNDIELLIGNMEYRGAQSIADGQFIRSVPASSINTLWSGFALTGGDDAIAGASAYRKFVAIRNNSLVNTVKINQTAADSAAGKGYVIDPGETAELEYKGQLYAKGTAGQTIDVVEFNYPAP